MVGRPQMFTIISVKNKMYQPRLQKPPRTLSLASLAIILAIALGISESAVAGDANTQAATVTATAIGSSAADDLLAPEQAFAVSARFRDAKTIELNYKIADGYYMYRKRFRVTSESPAFKIAKIVTPKGSVKQDATFGRVETYRKSVRVLLPVKRHDDATRAADDVIKVAVTSQGCADVGVCYPPYLHNLTLVVGSSDMVTPIVAGNAAPAALSVPNGSKSPGIADMLIKKAP